MSLSAVFYLLAITNISGDCVLRGLRELRFEFSLIVRIEEISVSIKIGRQHRKQIGAVPFFLEKKCFFVEMIFLMCQKLKRYFGF
ncbi:hypothetical protein D0S45_16850 [Marinifilum sp. JC120]|nr:hypothetical protein D0S45_16850 [Marinifilum sp. JC120]